MRIHGTIILIQLVLAGSLGQKIHEARADLEVTAGVEIHATTDFNEPLAAVGDAGGRQEDEVLCVCEFTRGLVFRGALRLHCGDNQASPMQPSCVNPMIVSFKSRLL